MKFPPLSLLHFPLYLLPIIARVAKLVDALCSGRSVRKDVLVRIQSRAPQWTNRKMIRFVHFFLAPTLIGFTEASGSTSKSAQKEVSGYNMEPINLASNESAGKQSFHQLLLTHFL
jgi:hypothetical protein